MVLKEVAIERTEREFFNALMEFNYLKSESKKSEVLAKAVRLAQSIPRYSSWPNDAKQFWNAEALCWRGRVDKEVRAAIAKELAHLENGYNLDLGAGSNSYVKNSVAVDFSEEMLLLSNAAEKVATDLEKELPFDDAAFDSVTAVFLVNYIKNFDNLIAEAKRVLKVNGKFVIVQSAMPVMELHRMHYRNFYGENEMKVLLKSKGFGVKSYLRNVNGTKLLFLVGERGI